MPSIIHKKSVEGFGIAYVEAAQYGIPSIGGKDGGASDAISHKKTGLICNGNELSSIHDSVNEILDNKKFPLVLGGEHSLTVGAIRPFIKKYTFFTNT